MSTLPSASALRRWARAQARKRSDVHIRMNTDHIRLLDGLPLSVRQTLIIDALVQRAFRKRRAREDVCMLANITEAS